MIQFGAILPEGENWYVSIGKAGPTPFFCATGIANFMGCSLEELPSRVVITLAQHPFPGGVSAVEGSKLSAYAKLFGVSAPMTFFGKQLTGVSNQFYEIPDDLTLIEAFEASPIAQALTGNLYWKAEAYNGPDF